MLILGMWWRKAKAFKSNSPKPLNGGRPCYGNFYEDQSCNTHVCRKYNYSNFFYLVMYRLV